MTRELGPREAAVQAAVISYLTCRGDVYFWRNNTGAFSPRPGQFIKFGHKGSADLLGVLAPTGKLLAVECKRVKGGVLSEDQERFGARVRECGGIYIVASSVDDVRAALPPPSVQLSPEHRRVFPR